jgi:succinate dehydrogenase / fumarate reductase membrane anchor subunit
MVKRYTKTTVGAHYGTGDWLLQRLTAVVMAAYTILVLVGIVMHRSLGGYAGWKAAFSTTWLRVATMLFVASLLYHAWVGMRDILMDYIKPTAVRLTAEFAVAFVLLFYLVWTASILWGLPSNAVIGGR